MKGFISVLLLVVVLPSIETTFYKIKLEEYGLSTKGGESGYVICQYLDNLKDELTWEPYAALRIRSSYSRGIRTPKHVRADQTKFYYWFSENKSALPEELTLHHKNGKSTVTLKFDKKFCWEVNRGAKYLERQCLPLT